MVINDYAAPDKGEKMAGEMAEFANVLICKCANGVCLKKYHKKCQLPCGMFFLVPGARIAI